jgi:hypothetical protein
VARQANGDADSELLGPTVGEPPALFDTAARLAAPLWKRRRRASRESSSDVKLALFHLKQIYVTFCFIKKWQKGRNPLKKLSLTGFKAMGGVGCSLQAISWIWAPAALLPQL